MVSSLEGKIALVIGSSSGIGEGIVEAIAEQKPKAIVIAARRLDLLEKIANKIKVVYKIEINPFRADVTIPNDIDDLLNQTREKYGSLDIVINSAGIIQKNQEPLETMSDERLDAIIKTNLNAVGYVAKRLIPIFREQNSGIYLVITSEAADISYDNYEPYCASKAGANRFIGAMSSTLKSEGISAYAFAIGPGLVDTEEARKNFPKTKEPVWRKAGNPLEFARRNIIPAIVNPRGYLKKYGPIRTVKTANAEDVE